MQAVTFLFGGLNVAEGVDHRLRRVGLVEVDADNVHAGIIAVERGLDQLLETVGDSLTIPVEDRGQLGLRDDLAHGRFRNRADRGPRITQVEEEFVRLGDIPDDLKVDVDDVFISGQHQARITAARAHTDLFGLFAGHGDHLGGHNRPGRKVEAGIAHLGELAQEQLDRLLFGPDRVERGHQPQDQRRQEAKPDGAACQRGATAAARPARAATALTAAPAHQDAQLLLALFDQLVDFGNLRALVARATPAATVVAAAAARAAIVAARTAGASAPRAVVTCHCRPLVRTSVEVRHNLWTRE